MPEGYEEITAQFLEEMAAVQAPNSEYIAALRDAMSELQIALDAARASSDRTETGDAEAPVVSDDDIPF